MLFKSITNINNANLTTQIINNVISFFDFGLVEQSGYVNVTIPTTGIYGGLDHRLRYINDPRYSSGTVWQSYKQNWVYESGYGLTPAIYVNNVLNTGCQINYKLGTVVFSPAIASTGVVTAQYSYKYVNVIRIEGSYSFNELITEYDSSNTDYINTSGSLYVLPENRTQLPVIGVELSRRSQIPRQIGGGQIVFTDLLIHCIANDVYTRDTLLDMVNLQYNKRFKMYDLNTMAEADDFPLKHGYYHSGKSFTQLVDNYPYLILRFVSMDIDSVYSLSPKTHIGTIRCHTEVYLGV